MSGTLTDPSAILAAGQGVQQTNPLQQIGQFAEVQNALNTNKLFPGQMKLQGQQVQTGQVDLASHIRQGGYTALVPLLSLPNITHQDVTNALAGYEAAGGISQPVLNDILKEAPTGDGADFNARARALIAANAQTSPAQAVAEVTPSQSTVDVGPAIQPLNIAPPGSAQPGAVSPVGGAFEKSLTPETLNTPATWTDNNGTTHQGTQAQYLQAVHGGQVGGLGTGTTPTAPAVAEPTPAANWNGFEYPASATAPSTAIASGVPEQQKNSTEMFNGDTNSVANASKTLTNLQSIVAEGENAGTGALADTLMKFGSTAQQLGLANGQQATDLQLIGKNVSQAVQSSLGTLGVPTDSKMSEIIEGTPNASMTPDAIKTAAAQLQGGIQWKQAELAAFQQYQAEAQKQGLTVGPGAYAQFNAQWQQKVPVAAFQLGGMPPSQRAQYWKSLDKSEKLSIYTAQKQMAQLGLAQQ